MAQSQGLSSWSGTSITSAETSRLLSCTFSRSMSGENRKRSGFRLTHRKLYLSHSPLAHVEALRAHLLEARVKEVLDAVIDAAQNDVVDGHIEVTQILRFTAPTADTARSSMEASRMRDPKKRDCGASTIFFDRRGLSPSFLVPTMLQ